MIIGITGTPGTGKTTVCQELGVLGYIIIDLNKIAEDRKLLNGFDPERQTYEINIEKLDKYLTGLLRKSAANQKTHGENTEYNKTIKEEKTIFLDGHVSHLLNIINLAIILRCHPSTLKRRLMDKGWPEKKVQENLEAEAIDVILVECVNKLDMDKIFEIDTTTLSLAEVVEIIIKISNGAGNEFKPGNIDWSEEILKWY